MREPAHCESTAIRCYRQSRLVSGATAQATTYAASRGFDGLWVPIGVKPPALPLPAGPSQDGLLAPMVARRHSPSAADQTQLAGSEKVIFLVSTRIGRMSAPYTAIPALTGSLGRFLALRSPRSSVYTAFAL